MCTIQKTGETTNSPHNTLYCIATFSHCLIWDSSWTIHSIRQDINAPFCLRRNEAEKEKLGPHSGSRHRQLAAQCPDCAHLWFLMVFNEGFGRKAVQIAQLGLHHDGNIAKKLLNDSSWDSIHCPADIGLNENNDLRKKKILGSARTSEHFKRGRRP